MEKIFRAWIAERNRYADSVTVYDDGSYSACIGNVDGFGEKEGDCLERNSGMMDEGDNYIYENDIVQLKGGKTFYRIIFKNGCFWINNKKEYLLLFMWSDCVIKGNIHENSELINKE